MAGLRCWRVSRRLWEYLDGEIAEPLRQRIEGHLRECDACQGLLSRLKEQAAAARLIEPISPPEDFAAKVMRRLEVMRAARPARSPSRPLSLAQAGWTATVFAALALIAGYFANFPARETRRLPLAREMSQRQAVEGSELRVQRPEPAVEGAGVEKSGGQKEAVVAIASRPRRPSQPTVRARKGIAPEQVSSGSPESEGTTTFAPALSAEEWLELAANYEESGYLEEALGAYQASAEQAKEKEFALLSMGRVYEKLGLAVPAIETFAEALAASGENSLTNGREEG